MATLVLPRSVTPHGVTVYARDNKLPAVILLFLVAVAIASLRQQHLPDRRQAGGLLGAALVVVLAAEVVPEVVVAFLAALVIVQAIESADVISAGLDRVLSLIGPLGGGPSGSTFTKQREG